MLKAAFVLCLQMLQSATNRQLWATCFTTLVGRAAAIRVGLPFGGTRKQNFRERGVCVVVISLLPFPMIRPYHYRYNGDIDCQGRAVVRVRIREHVVRVQDRDTEIGAVVRTTRASRDMTRFPFGSLRRLYISYIIMI